MTFKNILITSATVALTAACVISVFLFGESAISVITTCTTILGIYAIFIEMKRSKNIKHAQFLIYLNDYFTKDESNVRISFKLHQFIDHGKQTLTKEDHSDIIDFLLYWESVVPAILKNLFSLKKVDDMLSYRFFQIMNNPFVQKIELVPEAQFYCGCIKLHKKWTKYKKDYGLPILLEEHSLENNLPGYNKIANTK